MMHRVAAIDLGATSGRVMVGEFSSSPTARLYLREATRFPNNPVTTPIGLQWNLPELLTSIRTGLEQVAAETPIRSAAVDSWAVDYSIISEGQYSPPFHYRDGRTSSGVRTVHELIPFEELYDRNGLQFLPFNSLYQLSTEDPLSLSRADAILLIADLVSYLLTGVMRTEYTNASTTGLLGLDGSWDAEILEKLGIRNEIFPPMIYPGEQIGVITDPAIPSARGVPLLAVGSHDTASAVAAVPMDPNSSAYISCGTWGLVGVETSAQITTSAAREANFTNEGGVDGRNRFLHNVMGLWLLSESMRTWREGPGQVDDLPELLSQAAALTPPETGWVFDTNDPQFMSPGNMPRRIRAWFDTRDLPAPTTPAETVRSIIESLAVAFARAIDVASELSGIRVKNVHIVGGGSQNALLCQRTADVSGRQVHAGPVEATAAGNLLVQARHHGWVGSTLEDLRRVVADSFQLTTYTPRPSSRW